MRTKKEHSRQVAGAPALLFTCPDTNQRAPSGIQADIKSLRQSWSKTVGVNCSFCGGVHNFVVRELYTQSILRDAVGQVDRRDWVAGTFTPNVITNKSLI
jgi:hypothetical protein